MARPSAVKLLDLPTELLLQIIGYLDYLPGLNLSHTNSFFKSIVTLTSEQKRSFLCEAETWRRQDELFACSRCLKFRPRRAFSETQLKGKRRKGQASSNRRFCVDCGIKYRIYQPSQLITVDKTPYYLCDLCRKMIGTGVAYCKSCGLCRKCINTRVMTVLTQSEAEFIDLFQVYRNENCFRCHETYIRLGRRAYYA